MSTDMYTGNAATPLLGRTALVTGALGGLGSRITESLAAAGARVVIHHLHQGDEAAAAVAALAEQGHSATCVEADVTDWGAVADMVHSIESKMDGIDILVNNAGFMAPAKFLEMTPDEWAKTINVDLTGVFTVSRHVAPGMLRLGRGSIINMSSQLAFKGAHEYSSYCAAKAGVVGLTRAMARELGPTVRVNAVAPGPIDTAFVAPWKSDEWVEERTRDSVIRRLGEAHEVAPAVVFLASDGASLLHGQTLHLNGGGVMAG